MLSEEINGSFHPRLVQFCCCKVSGPPLSLAQGITSYRTSLIGWWNLRFFGWLWMQMILFLTCSKDFFQRFRHLKINLELGRCRLGKLLAVNCRGSCVVERVLLTVNSGWDFFQDSSLSPLAPYRHRMARNAYPDKEQPARWKFGQEPRGLLPT